MNLSKVEKIIIMVLVIGGILAAGFFFLIKPAYDGIDKAEKNLEKAEKAHAELVTKLERLNTIDDDINKAKEDIEGLEENFYPDLTTYEAVEIILAHLKELELETMGVSVSTLSTEQLELEYFEEKPIVYDLKTYAKNAKETKEGEIILAEGQFLDDDKVYTVTVNSLSSIVITDEEGTEIEPAKYTETMAKAYKEALCRYASDSNVSQTVSAITVDFEISGEYKKYLDFVDYLYNFERATYIPSVTIPVAFEVSPDEDGKYYTEEGEEVKVDANVSGPVSVDYRDTDIVSDMSLSVVFYGVEQIEELENIEISGTKIVTNQ